MRWLALRTVMVSLLLTLKDMFHVSPTHPLLQPSSLDTALPYLTSVIIPSGGLLPASCLSFMDSSSSGYVLLECWCSSYFSWVLFSHAIYPPGRCHLSPCPQHPDANDTHICIWPWFLSKSLYLHTYPISWTPPLGYQWAEICHFDSLIGRQFDLKQWSPTFRAPGTCFVEHNFSTDRGGGEGWFRW